jgi:osmotically-inducible protein OsmY
MQTRTLGRIVSVALGLAGAALVAGPARAGDADILERIEARFEKAGLAQDTDIAISVEGEIVHLRGIAVTLADARRAEREARKVAEIVINEIRVFPEVTRSDRAIQKDAEKAVYTYARYGVFDAVGISVDQGIVSIEGFVNDSVRRREIEERVARVDGVRDVHNDLRLQGTSSYDERLRLQMYARIYNDPLFEEYASWSEPPVRVFVDRGRITLAGTVRSKVEQVALSFMARESLALSVQNIVQVEGSVPEEDAPRDDS